MTGPALGLLRLAGLGVSVSTTATVGAIVAAVDSNPLVVGTAVGSVLVFAGLLVQQVIRNQRAVWGIVRSKDETIERLQWQIDQDRFRHGEGRDPGPFIPSRERRP